MRSEMRRLAVTFAALLALLALTVTLSFVPLGRASPVASFGIAIAKTALIVWFFMGFRSEGWPVRLAAIAGVVWLLLLLGLLLLDLWSRGWLMPFFTSGPAWAT